MAAGRFTLYDVVVDLIPGGITLLLAIWISQSAIASEVVQEFGTALPAIAFLAVAYITGRTIHALTSITIIGRIGVALHNQLPYVEQVDDHDRRFLYRLYILNESEKVGKSVEHTTAEQAVQYLCNEIDFKRNSLSYETGDISETGGSDKKDDNDAFAREGSIGDINDLRYLRYLADTITYESQSLSWKYGILATFFRNMWVVLIITAIVYFVFRTAQLLLIANGDIFSFIQVLVIALMLFGAAVISLHQRYIFKRRQIRTKINELALLSETD